MDYSNPIPSPAINPLLAKILAPLSKYYDPTDTVEIFMGRAGQVIVDRRGGEEEFIDDTNLTISAIETICTALANKHGLQFDADTNPKLSCVLPYGHRFECLVGPSVQSGISLAIRCKHPFIPEWSQFGVTDYIRDYLTKAMFDYKNFIISGATNTGKTTLINMLLATLPWNRRVIALEDTPELQVERFEKGSGLLAEREATPNSILLNWEQLGQHLLRITPKHIIFGEISTQNAFPCLDCMSVGINGVGLTIHASSVEQALTRKFEQKIEWSGRKMYNIPEYLAENINVVVQIKTDHDGYRHISDIYEPQSKRFVIKDGEVIQS